MPELPEVETLRRSLSRRLIGARVTRATVRRRDVVHGPATRADLLADDRIVALERHGKQLAVVGASGRCVVIHLGMSGQVLLQDRAPRPLPPHTHLVWGLGGQQDSGTTEQQDIREGACSAPDALLSCCPAVLLFRDPRRFGGLWTSPTFDELRRTRWSALGPDALTVTAAALHAGLSRTRRAVKAALLDQHLVAGLGNIYIDELLHATAVHPLTPGRDLTRQVTAALARHTRRLLARAIAAGGSTLRDYVSSDGSAGRYQHAHRVYGRAGEPCLTCGTALSNCRVAARTTVWCPVCQREHGWG